MHHRFYLGKHSGRQLSLQPQHGSADLNTTFFGARRAGDAEPGAEDSSAAASTSSSGAISAGKGMRKHIIQVSTYQMVILMLFNNKDAWTYDVSVMLGCCFEELCQQQELDD